MVRGWVLSCAALLLLSASTTALADGGFFVVKEDVPVGTTPGDLIKDGKFTSSGQQAVFVKHDDGWDLSIWPGRLGVAGAAWLLPLPQDPATIEAVDSTLIDQLSFATGPTFETRQEDAYYCRITREYGESSGCGGFGDLFALGSSTGAAMDSRDVAGLARSVPRESVHEYPPAVRQLQSGNIGPLEYEVIKAVDADLLEAWLNSNGYAVPDGFSTIAAHYLDQGWVFFAARYTREAGAPETVGGVTFSMPGLLAPVYPVILTKLSVDSVLEFTTYVIATSAFRPADTAIQFIDLGENEEFDIAMHDADWVDDDAAEPFELKYQLAVNNIVSTQSERTMAVQYAAELTTDEVDYRLDYLGDAETAPMTADTDTWHEALRPRNDQTLFVTRLYGRFPKAFMNADLPVLSWIPAKTVTAHYGRTVTTTHYLPEDHDTCRELAGLPPARNNRGPALLVLAALLLTALGLCRLHDQ